MNSPAEIFEDEKDLIARLRDDNQAAFTKIFYRYADSLYGFVLGKLKSEEAAEEIVQEMFVKLWGKRNTLAEVENLRAYLFAMAVNKTYDHFRKLTCEEQLRKVFWQRLSEQRNDVMETMDFKESQELISQAVERLPAQRKKVFLMSRQQGMSHAEIAQQLNLSPSTVNNHLTEALRAVREYLHRSPRSTIILFAVLTEINGQSLFLN